MEFINDKNGVDVNIEKAETQTAFKVNLDFNYSRIKLDALDNLNHSWNIDLFQADRLIGKTEFTLYQFIADGIERRTINLTNFTLFSTTHYDESCHAAISYIVDLANEFADTRWGIINTRPVIFIEHLDFKHCGSDQHGMLKFFKSIGQKILGLEVESDIRTSSPEITLSPIGEDISMQLIEGHLSRTHSTHKL